MSTKESIDRRIQQTSGLDNTQFDTRDLEIAKSLSPSSSFYSGKKSQIDMSKYTPYLGESISPYDLDVRRAESQPVGEKLLGVINQTLSGEIAGGTLEGIGHLLDFEQSIKALSGETQEWGNWLTDLGKSLRTWSEDETPIHTNPSNCSSCW